MSAIMAVLSDPDLLRLVFESADPMASRWDAAHLLHGGCVCTLWRDASAALRVRVRRWFTAPLTPSVIAERLRRPYFPALLPSGELLVTEEACNLHITEIATSRCRDVAVSDRLSCAVGVVCDDLRGVLYVSGGNRVTKLRQSDMQIVRSSAAVFVLAEQIALFNSRSVIRAPPLEGEVRMDDEHTLLLAVDHHKPNPLTVLDAETLEVRLEHGEGVLRHPRGIAVLGCDIFVSNHDRHRIDVYNLTSQGSLSTIHLYHRRWFGSLGAAAGCFHHPMGLATAHGRLYVAEYGNHRVQVLTPEGRPMQIIAMPHPMWGLYADPRELRVFAVSKRGGCVHQLKEATPAEAARMLVMC
jgi:hypothetical protein